MNILGLISQLIGIKTLRLTNLTREKEKKKEDRDEKKVHLGSSPRIEIKK